MTKRKSFSQMSLEEKSLYYYKRTLASSRQTLLGLKSLTPEELDELPSELRQRALESRARFERIVPLMKILVDLMQVKLELRAIGVVDNKIAPWSTDPEIDAVISLIDPLFKQIPTTPQNGKQEETDNRVSENFSKPKWRKKATKRRQLKDR